MIVKIVVQKVVFMLINSAEKAFICSLCVHSVVRIEFNDPAEGQQQLAIGLDFKARLNSFKADYLYWFLFITADKY